MRDCIPPTRGTPGLIVIDAQRIFLDRVSPACLPDAVALLGRIRGLVGLFRARNLPVAFSMHVEPSECPRGTMAAFFPRPIVEDDPLSALMPEVATMANQQEIFKKPAHDAFQAGIPDVLAGADTIFIAGVQSPLCILASAIGLARHRKTAVVVADACGARDRAAHDAAIRCLAAGHAHICDCHETAALLDGVQGVDHA